MEGAGVLRLWEGALSGGLLNEIIYQLAWKDFNISICITTTVNANSERGLGGLVDGLDMEGVVERKREGYGS